MGQTAPGSKYHIYGYIFNKSNTECSSIRPTYIFSA